MENLPPQSPNISVPFPYLNSENSSHKCFQFPTGQWRRDILLWRSKRESENAFGIDKRIQVDILDCPGKIENIAGYTELPNRKISTSHHSEKYRIIKMLDWKPNRIQSGH